MKKVIITIIIFSTTQLFSQTGGGIGIIKKILANSSVMVSMNQSFYDKDWNNFIEDMETGLISVDKKTFRRINFTFMGQFEGNVLSGFKYLKYGLDIETSDDGAGEEPSFEGIIDGEVELELNFLKLFLTYPLGNGLYFGVEGGYFLEGKIKYKYTSSSYYGNETEKETETIDADDWVDDLELSRFDYGILGQYFFNIQPKILLTVEGYYGLSKFSEDKDTEDIGLPNTYHYLNLGLTYKFGK